MNNQQGILNRDQSSLVNELVESYGIDPGEVIFFPDDPKPFLSYEATSAVANHLTDLHDIDIKPIDAVFADSLSLKCTLTISDQKTRSAVGVVNLKETIDDKPMSPSQLYQTASARAIRNALRAAGIDLIKLHEQRKSGTPAADTAVRSTRESLLAQAHALGTEAGLITRYTDGLDKKPWRRLLWHRYSVESASLLSDHYLADLVAVLKTIVGPEKLAA